MIWLWNIQKTLNLLDDTTNQPSKFRTRNWVKINNKSRRTYTANNDIKFKTSMISSNLWNCNHAYIQFKATITVQNTAATAATVNNTNIKAIFKSCAPFINCISQINNTQLDGAQAIDIVILMSNLIVYTDVYSKTSRSLWQYYRDKPALHNNHNIIVILASNNNSISFKFKQQLTREIWST